MSKKCLIPLAVLLFVTAQTFGATETFEAAHDYGLPDPIVAGSVVFNGMVEFNGELVDQYLVTGYGWDFQSNTDQGFYAYRELEGDWRISANFEWEGNVPHDWSKQGVMIRSMDTFNAAHGFTLLNRNQNVARVEMRRDDNGGTSGGGSINGGTRPEKLGIQRVTLGGMSFVEHIVDFGTGDGWQRIGNLELRPQIPQTALYGVAVTSHTAWDTVTSKVTDVRYEQVTADDLAGDSPGVVVAADTMTPGGCEDLPSGFQVRSIKALFTDGWGYNEMNKLLDWGCTGPLCTGPGMPIPGTEEGTRISQFVNFRDTGQGGFGNDESFPGIDPFEQPAGDPAAGDDDNNFATEVLACVFLTEGYHMWTIASDDGTILEIGGVEVYRTEEWKGTSPWRDVLLDVEADGWYSLRARWLEGGGGATLELHEVLADGTRILLGDVANGGSPVVVPEPATIALLGLGGLALVRIRRKS